MSPVRRASPEVVVNSGPDIGLLEARIREKIAKLQAEFATKRDGIIYMLEATKRADLTSPGPYRCYGIDTRELDSITIQIGTLTLVLMQILELRKEHVG